MNCSECNKSYLESPIKYLCPNCALVKWRYCRTYLQEFRRNVEISLEEPKKIIHDYLESFSEFRIDTYKKTPRFFITKKMKWKNQKGIVNLKINEIPSRVLDALCLENYQVNESTHQGSNFIFFWKKDTMMVSNCSKLFSPSFLYQLYCDKCWNELEERRINLIIELRKKKGQFNISEFYDRFCIVCNSLFQTKIKTHHLCKQCENVWLSCSSVCHSYFLPYMGRKSESYCFECRQNISKENEDLLCKLSKLVNIESTFNFERHIRSDDLND